MSPQLVVNSEHAKAFDGMISDMKPRSIESFAAQENIPFGRGVVSGTEKGKEVVLPRNEIATLTFDADFVASNVITITVNGIAAAAVTFDTDHATTALAVNEAINALEGVTSSVNSGGNSRIFTITAAGTDIVVSETVTGGASQATGTPVYSSGAFFKGFSVQTHKQQNVINGSLATQYQAGDRKDTVNVMRFGSCWLPYVASEAPAGDETFYIQVGGDDAGKITNSSTDNLAATGWIVNQVDADYGRCEVTNVK